MCSISGYLRFKHSPTGNQVNCNISEKITSIIQKGESRGRDSFGYMSLRRTTNAPNLGHTTIKKFIGRPSDFFINDDITIHDDDFLLLSNNRAEPTTEFVKNKHEDDVQPYYGDGVWAVHNGTIANDKALIFKYNLDPKTKIDSIVIPYVLAKTDFTQKTLYPILSEELIGSFALGAYSEEYGKLVLATNYKPLFLLFDRSTQVLYFSSIEEYLSSDDYNRIYGDDFVLEVKPYTCLIVDAETGRIEQFSIYRKKQGTPKALICASSGLDSTVAATWAKAQGYDITLLHFKYKCRAEQKEWSSIQNIANHLSADLISIDADFFKGVIGGSRLYNEQAEITKEGDVGAELAIEWVPARNLVFLSIAAGIAEARGIDYIVLGGNLEESGAYADNELIFQTKFNDILPNALNLQNQVNVLTPVANLMKHEIVKLGVELDAPLHLTWSCYENGEKHCGKCGPCFMRRTAFEMNNIPEVIQYES